MENPSISPFKGKLELDDGTQVRVTVLTASTADMEGFISAKKHTILSAEKIESEDFPPEIWSSAGADPVRQSGEIVAATIEFLKKSKKDRFLVVIVEKPVPKNLRKEICEKALAERRQQQVQNARGEIDKLREYSVEFVAGLQGMHAWDLRNGQLNAQIVEQVRHAGRSLVLLRSTVFHIVEEVLHGDADVFAEIEGIPRLDEGASHATFEDATSVIKLCYSLSALAEKVASIKKRVFGDNKEFNKVMWATDLFLTTVVMDIYRLSENPNLRPAHIYALLRQHVKDLPDILNLIWACDNIMSEGLDDVWIKLNIFRICLDCEDVCASALAQTFDATNDSSSNEKIRARFARTSNAILVSKADVQVHEIETVEKLPEIEIAGALIVWLTMKSAERVRAGETQIEVVRSVRGMIECPALYNPAVEKEGNLPMLSYVLAAMVNFYELGIPRMALVQFDDTKLPGAIGVSMKDDEQSGVLVFTTRDSDSLLPMRQLKSIVFGSEIKHAILVVNSQLTEAGPIVIGFVDEEVFRAHLVK